MPQTITITNFGGRLTRILNGDMNSGMAKFTQSWGYDPFSKPQNLTWLEKPADISTGITDLILAAKPRFETSTQYIYAVGSSGKIYKIQPVKPDGTQINSVILTGSVAINSPAFTHGASIEFFGDTEKIFVGSDTQLNSLNFDFTGDTQVGTTANYVINVYRPLRQFIGKLFFGNGNTVGAVDATGTVTSSVIGMAGTNRYSELNPGLPVEAKVTDLDVSIDGNYLLLTASNIPNENITTVSNDRQDSSSSDAGLYQWNGVDKTITAFTSIPSYAVTALQTYLQSNIFFSNDSFGSSLNDGTNKILTLPNNKSPLPNSTLVNGNFISWISPEVSTDGTTTNASLYYFGSLDQENSPGLYRLMRYSTTLSSGFIYQVPLNILTNNKYQSVNNAITALLTWGLGQHYFSTFEINNANTTPSTTTAKLYKFLVTPSGTGTPQLGVYETQTQLFSNKIAVKQVRVYTEPTASGNGFQLDLIGSDGNVITNGTFTYTYAAGTDPISIQGALERINYNFGISGQYALGVRITNTGTTNMTIKKVEIDIVEEGK